MTQLGQPSYQAGDVAPNYQRWMRFANSVLRASSVEYMSRLLSYAQTIEPTKAQDIKAYQAFTPSLSVLPSSNTFQRLPQLRASDTTPLQQADYDAAVDALVDATIDAYPKRQDLAAAIRDCQPLRHDLEAPARRNTVFPVLDHPVTGKGLVRILTQDKELADEFMEACLAVVEKRWPDGPPAPPPQDDDEATTEDDSPDDEATTEDDDQPDPWDAPIDGEEERQKGYDYAKEAIAKGTPADTLRSRIYDDPDDFDQGVLSYLDSLLDFL